jgi:hypothetical protein
MTKNHWCCFHCRGGSVGPPLNNIVEQQPCQPGFSFLWVYANETYFYRTGEPFRIFPLKLLDWNGSKLHSGGITCLSLAGFVKTWPKYLNPSAVQNSDWHRPPYQNQVGYGFYHQHSITITRMQMLKDLWIFRIRPWVNLSTIQSLGTWWPARLVKHSTMTAHHDLSKASDCPCLTAINLQNSFI